MRVLVTGGRDYADSNAVYQELDRLKPLFVIHGGATGTDDYVAYWAELHGVAVASFEAHWDKFADKKAGPIRNGWMIRYGKPDLVLAFPGGRDTADCVRQAKAAGIKVREVGRIPVSPDS